MLVMNEVDLGLTPALHMNSRVLLGESTEQQTITPQNSINKYFKLGKYIHIYINAFIFFV